jgi:starch synthase
LYCMNFMNIVHIASEFAPIAKVGGLGDVLYGLSKALIAKGHRVTVILPKYDVIEIQNISVLKNQIVIRENGHEISNTLWGATYHGIELILIESHDPKNYFKRGKIYGEIDDNDRFLFFNKVACAAIETSSFDAIHLHDWPTAGCTLFLKGKPHPKIIFTIHNLMHQGRCAPQNLVRLGIDYDEKELSDPIFDEALNLMRAALQYCDIITAVSPTYEK